MEALLYVRRPDLHVASVDPGYALQGSQQEAEAAEVRDAVIDCFNDVEQKMLRSTDAWYASRIDAYADSLPFEAESVDLVFSYAAVPEYSSGPQQDAKDLREMLRVVKKGGAILNGPMNEIVHEDWRNMLESLHNSGEIQKYEIRMDEMDVGTVYFSEVIK
jgi:ubiquinone/menaquinone biosynthesis C-methylase UbiE